MKILTRRRKEESWSDAASLLEDDMKHNRSYSAFSRIRQFLRPKGIRCDDLNDSSGNALSTTDNKLNRWSEHFSELLNTELKVDEDLLNATPTANSPDDEPPPSRAMIAAAVKRLKNRKTPGVCLITAEMLKHGGDTIIDWLHQVISIVWSTERSPQDWKDAAIVTIFKKGDIKECGNFRGISLLSIPGKVYALLLFDHVSARMEATILEHQAGFRRGRGTTDQLFTLSQILSHATEFDNPTHTCFIDLRKAYDTVNRNAMWRILKQSGLSGKLQRLLQELHTDTRATVKAYGQSSEPFDINNGVRQGCVLAPALFNLFLDHVVRQALNNIDEGVTLRYTVDGELHIKHRRPNELLELVQILLYADDMAIVCSSPEGLSRLVTSLDNITQAWHLDISQPKTKILSVDRNNSQQKPSINLRGVDIQCVESFTYLGRKFCAHPSLDEEIASRLQKAAHSFWRLKSVLYSRKEISTRTKVRIYKCTVLPTLLYGSEMWAPLVHQLRRLEAFQIRCLRYILGIRFATHGKVTNKSIRSRCSVRPITDILRTNRLRWL